MPECPISTRSGAWRTSPTRSSTSSAPSAGPRPRAGTACTSTSGSSRGGASATSARRRWRSPARSSGALPQDATTTWWRKDREPDKAFVDFNQNARDHTIACAYSVRGVREGTVSTPITWDEIDDVDPQELTIATVPERFARLGDLHAGIDDAVFSLEPLLEWAEREPPAEG